MKKFNFLRKLFFKEERKDKWIWSWRKVSLSLAILMSFSFVFEFMRLYQDESAKKAAVVMQGMPPECSPDDMTIWQSAKASWKFYLSWNYNPCEKYFRAAMVNPIWEVTPLMVVSSSLTRTVINPVEQIASSLGQCFNLFFSNIPTLWQPIILILVTLLSIIFALVKSGYRVAIPFVFSIEPSHAPQQSVKNGKTVYIVDKSGEKKKSVYSSLKVWLRGGSKKMEIESTGQNKKSVKDAVKAIEDK